MDKYGTCMDHVMLNPRELNVLIYIPAAYGTLSVLTVPFDIHISQCAFPCARHVTHPYLSHGGV